MIKSTTDAPSTLLHSPLDSPAQPCKRTGLGLFPKGEKDGMKLLNENYRSTHSRISSFNSPVEQFLGILEYKQQTTQSENPERLANCRMCMYCGEISNEFTPDALKMHFTSKCYMLCKCELCDAVSHKFIHRIYFSIFKIIA